jgi:hypothetical protein
MTSGKFKHKTSALQYRTFGDSEALHKVRSILYSNTGELPNDELDGVINSLRLMAARNDLAAMHQLGQILWEGLVVEKDVREASALFEKAISMNYSPAYVSLGAFRHANAQSDNDYERAAECFNAYSNWQQQEEQRLGSDALFYARNLVHIGETGLNEWEFVTRFGISINDVSYLATSSVLRKINDWRLAAKRMVASFQRSELERNPRKSSHINPRRLPLAPLNGFCVTATLAGDENITHLGLSLGWGRQSSILWLPLTDFGIRNSEQPSLQSIEKFSCIYGYLSESAANKIRSSIDSPNSISLLKRFHNVWRRLFHRQPTDFAEYNLRIRLCMAIEGSFCTVNYGRREISFECQDL